MIYRRLLFSLVLLSTAACATGRGGSPLYRREIGMASAPDAITLAEQVIHRHGYQIAGAEEAPEIRILTHWRYRLPFEDEVALGVTGAESRILIVGRARNSTDLGTYYVIHLTMENRLQTDPFQGGGEAGWSDTVNTDMFTDYADEIADDYKLLVSNIGVRRYR
jgi:hypothetical protein